MFEQFPVAIDVLKGGRDAARLVDAAVDWVKVAAAAEAQRFAIIAEFAVLSLADAGDEDACLWWVDEEDDVIAEISAAFGVSTRWAMGDLAIGAAMRERFPGLAAVFLRGEISAKVMATVVDRTLLVTDADALAAIDGACVAAAQRCGWSGLSYSKLKNAVDVWVHRHDPAAVRRARDKVRGRRYTVRDEKDGTSAVFIQMGTPGAALVTGRLRAMAKGVCPDDPRTLEQRMVDALEALAADANHVKCLCGSPTCPATADDGVASRYIVHIYAEAATVDVEPDPLIHGEDPHDVPLRPSNVTIRYPETKTSAGPKGDDADPAVADPAVAEPAVAEPARSAATSEPAEPAAADGAPTVPVEPAEAVDVVEPPVDVGGGAESMQGTEPATAEHGAEPATAEHGTEPATGSDAGQAPTPSRARQCPAPATPAAQIEPEPETPAEPTAATAEAARDSVCATRTASPARVGPPTGVIPGYGIVCAPLLAALLAGGAEVRDMTPPAVDPETHYRLSTALADFIRGRDLSCRFPGCDRPIDEADLDHTIAWADGGPTHASNVKGYCRRHHLIKTFRDGWSDTQKADGTIILTSPIGRTYTSLPTSQLLFPTIDTTSAPIQPGSPRRKPADDKTTKMPKRKRSKAQDRAYRITAERALNAAHLAAENIEPPPTL